MGASVRAHPTITSSRLQPRQNQTKQRVLLLCCAALRRADRLPPCPPAEGVNMPCVAGSPRGTAELLLPTSKRTKGGPPPPSPQKDAHTHAQNLILRETPSHSGCGLPGGMPGNALEPPLGSPFQSSPTPSQPAPAPAVAGSALCMDAPAAAALRPQAVGGPNPTLWRRRPRADV